MSFYGCSFSYNGIHSSQFNLMVYDFGSVTNDESPKFTSAPKIIEDRLPNKYRSYYYGSVQNEPLKIKLVFGINTDMIDDGKHLDRYDIDAISAWITSSNGYQWLYIDQHDMEGVRYRCVANSLTLVEDGHYPYAFSCEFQCDSPFGYLFPKTYTLSSDDISNYTNDTREYHIINKSSYNGYYYPKMSIRFTQSSGNNSNVSIKNESDDDRETSINWGDTVTDTIKRVDVDNDKCIISTYEQSGAPAGLDIYNMFNYNFFRLKRGDNLIRLKGKFSLEITCEYPVNFGG